MKTYHDTRNSAKKHKVKPGEAVPLKREKKRKGETPFESYVYIATKIVGSTIRARRANDGETVCRDEPKFKLLRTAYLPAKNEKRPPPTARTVVPPAATHQAAPNATQTTPVVTLAATQTVTQDIVTQHAPVVTPPFDGHLKNYA